MRGDAERGDWIAALPMYDLAEVGWAYDAIWTAIAARVSGAPGRLVRGRDIWEVWQAPDLLLAQACGYPLVTQLAGRVQLVGTPHYGVPGCEGALYRSALIVRADDPAGSLAGLAGRVAAMNGWDSQSGMNALRDAVAPFAQGGRFFGRVVVTGAHAESVRAVAQGAADIAAIDAVSWALLVKWRPQAVAGLRVLAWSRAVAGLPMITAAGTSGAVLQALRAALASVAEMPELAEARAAVFWQGFSVLGLGDYAGILAMEAAAIARGYAQLR